MHDWTLLSILFGWKAGRVTLEFTTERAELAKLVAHEASALHVPRRNEWVPVSASIRWAGRRMKHRGGAN